MTLYLYELIKHAVGRPHYRICDENDNAIGFCYEEDNARTITLALNVAQDDNARTITLALNVAQDADRLRAERDELAELLEEACDKGFLETIKQSKRRVEELSAALTRLIDEGDCFYFIKGSSCIELYAHDKSRWCAYCTTKTALAKSKPPLVQDAARGEEP